jgi:hypothetical protein
VFAENSALLFEQLIRDTLALQLDDRSRVIGTTDMRLELALAPKSEGNTSKYWLLDFVKIRYASGPGKANKAGPIEGFALDEGDGFGEETSALFDPSTKHLIVQYNHHGPRAQSFPAYFVACLGEGIPYFNLTPRMDSQAETRFQTSKIVRRLEFKVCPPSAGALRDMNVGLGEAIDMGNRLGGASITITIAAKKGGRLDLTKVGSIVQALLKGASPTNGSKDVSVESVKVITKATEESRAETIDLLSPKLEIEVGDLALGNDLRFTRQSRWNALIEARDQWSAVVTI